MATKNPRPPPKPAQGLPNGYVSKGGPESYDAHDNFQPTANYLSKDPKAFHVRVHVNNDKFEPGKKMTVQVNKVKTFENFLEECTEKMKPAFGAARRLYTARGRKRIQNLEELTEDSIYVITGNEPFKKHNYKEIPERQRPLPVRGFKKIDISRIYTPVQHALEERLRHKSGRSYYLNEHRRGLRLRVHVNGENERPYCPVSIRYKDRENFIKILEEIERTLQLQPIEKVYKVINQGGKSENFTEITDAEHLEQDEHVLVLPKNEKKLQADKIYHLDGKKNFRVGVSPRHGPAYNFPSFPDFDAGFKHNKSLNKHRPLPSIGSSQKGSEPISPFSNPPNSQGSRQRSKGRTPKQADYDQDAGGVYRAKKQNNAKGAAMVNETNDTHIERPIDQMEAEVVDEEEDIKEKITPIPPGTELNKQPSKELKKNEPKETKNGPKEAKGLTKDSKNGTGEKKSTKETNGPSKVKEVNSESVENKNPFQKLDVLPPINGEANGEVQDDYKEESIEIVDELVNGNGDEADMLNDMNRNSSAKVREGIVDGHVKETVEFFENLDKDDENVKPVPIDEAEMENNDIDMEKEDEVNNGMPFDESNTATIEVETKKGDEVKPLPIDGSNTEQNDVAMRREATLNLEFNNIMEEPSGEVNDDDNEYEQTLPETLGSPQVVHSEQDKDQSNEEAGMNRINEYDDSFNQLDRNSGLAQNKNIRSSTPASRGASRRKEIKQHQAAVKIQAGARGYMERKRFKQRKAEMEAEKQEEQQQQQRQQQGKADQKKNLSEDDAATIVQASFKGYKTRKDLNLKKQQVRDGQNRAETDAAVKIQSGYRGYLARKELRVKKESEKLTDINDNEKKDDQAAKAEAAIKIQSSFRGYKTRKELNPKKKEGGERLSKDEAATKIQANYRGYKTRKNLAKSKSEKPVNNQTDLAKVKNAAAVKVQANFKGYIARKEYQKKKEDKEADAAASKIQAAFKGYKVRKESSKNQQLPDQAPTPKPDSSDLDKAATKIQSGFRGYKTRKELKSKVIGEEIVETDMAQLPESARTKLSSKHDQSLLDDKGKNASKIQNAFRMFREKKKALLEESFNKNTNKAKNKIIAGFNGYVTRKNHKEVLRKTKAQTNIQSQFRGFIVRHSKVHSHVHINELHAAVRGYVTRKLNNVRSEAFDRLSKVANGDRYATIIQSLCRAFITRQSVKLRIERTVRPTKSATLSIQGPTELSPTKSEEISFWQDSNIKMYSDKTKRLAAARIQSAFHACKLRDGYQSAVKNEVSKVHVVPNHDDQQPRKLTESMISAATKINAYYKGYQVRKISQAVSKHGLTDDFKVETEKPKEMTNGEVIKEKVTEDKEGLVQESCGENDDEDLDADKSVKSIIQVSFEKKIDKDQHFKDGAESKSEHEVQEIVIDDETKIRTSTRLSGPANSLKSGSLTLSDLETRKGSGKSTSTWKSHEKVKAQFGEVELEGESAREIEDDAGELSSIEKNVRAVSQLQAAFRACQFRRELRREISELNGGGSELMDIKNVDRAVSALKKDFHLRSAKVRRLGSYQFGRERSPKFGKNWWEDSAEADDNGEIKDKIKEIGGDDSSLVIQNENEKTAEAFVENKTTINKDASRIQASAKAYLARKDHTKHKHKNKAKESILAAYRGYITRKTAQRIKSAQSRRSGSGKSNLSRTRAGNARKRSAGKTVRIQSAKKRTSPASQRTVFHVQMHSDVIQQRVTLLQAAFAGYQTRKVHIALSKIMAESANDYNASNQMERMGSLSETDDVKLRHKSIAKIQALETQRLQQANGTLQRLSIPKMGKRSPNTLNSLLILPPISQSMTILEERSSRPKSGVSTRSQASSLSLTEGKSKSQPNLFHRKNGDNKELSGIEMYIQKKVAATLLQAYARAWFTREKYRSAFKSPANQADEKSEIPDTKYRSQKSRKIGKADSGKNNEGNKQSDLNTSEQSVKSNASVTSDKSTERMHTDAQKERGSPMSVGSKSSKVTFKSTTSKSTKEGSNKAKEEMTEMVRHRTASVKLEAERRKLIAEKIRLQRDTNEERRENTDGKHIQQKSPVKPERAQHKETEKEPNKVNKNKTDIKLDQNIRIQAQGTGDQDNDVKETITEPFVLQTDSSDINKTGETESHEMLDSIHVNSSLFGNLREPLSPILSSRLNTDVDFHVSNGENTTAAENDHVNIIPELNEIKIQENAHRQNNAAVTIQKNFRGFRARKGIIKKQKSTRKMENEYKDWKSKRIEAAIAIQSAWRGYSVRKDMTDRDEATVEGFIGFNNEPKGLIVIHIGRSKSEIERSNRRYENCSMIQLVFRACNVKRNFAVKGAVRRQEKNKAATRIQALYHAFMTRKNWKKQAAARRIQNVCKAYLTRVANEERKRKLVEDQKIAATYLQSTYRSFMRRRQNEAEKEDRKINRAAIDIQSIIRAFVVRWELGKRQDRLQLEAADKIQQSARGYMMRKHRRIQKEKVSIITAAFRSFKARQQVQACLNKRRTETEAATRLQAAYRAYVTRKKQAYVDNQQREREAATRLQATYKAFVTRRINKEYKDRMAREDLAASKILCSYRGMKARRMYRKLKAELARKREKAAIKIQAHYRGYRGRMVVRKAKEVRETHEMVVDLVDLVVHRALDYIRRRNISAERIQATVKGYETRQEIMARLSDEEKIRKRQMQVNARCIQAVVRAKRVRDRQNRKRRAIERNNAAIKIQSLYRGYRTRKAVAEEKEMLANLEPPPTALISARTNSGKLLSISVDEVLLKNSRAIIIFHRKASELQAAFRGRKVREALKDRLVRKSLVAKKTPRRVLNVGKNVSPVDEAAILIQKTFKGYYDRKTYTNAVRDRKKKWNRCAAVIHAAFRGYRERTIERKKALKFGPERVGEILIAKYQAANVIAAAYRGFSHRKHKKELRVEM